MPAANNDVGRARQRPEISDAVFNILDMISLWLKMSQKTPHRDGEFCGTVLD